MSRSADEQGARTGTPPGSSSKPMRKLHLSSLRPGPSSGVAAAAAALSEEEAAEMRRATKHLLLAVGMLAAGTANTISAKASFSTLSAGRVERGGTPRPFDHPFVMAGTMFLGEALCLAYHALKVRLSPKKRRRHSFPKIVCALPALCDILATSVMYVGLTLTSASTFQMLRSSAVLFTALLSVIFLKRKQWKFHWVGAALVFLGTLVVGSVSALDAAEDGGEGVGNPRLGDACVVLSQVFYAVQMCLEERFVVGYKIPALQAVGWEGVWGCMGIALLLCALQFLPAGGVAGALPNVVEDSVDALAQLRETPHLVMLLSINRSRLTRSTPPFPHACQKKRAQLSPSLTGTLFRLQHLHLILQLVWYLNHEELECGVPRRARLPPHSLRVGRRPRIPGMSNRSYKRPFLFPCLFVLPFLFPFLFVLIVVLVDFISLVFHRSLNAQRMSRASASEEVRLAASCCFYSARLSTTRWSSCHVSTSTRRRMSSRMRRRSG